MGDGSYFSQYESPNIVIVPSMSTNPPSPKRRKIGNNIIVPIVDNATCEKQKLKSSGQINNPDSTALNTDNNADTNQSSSISPPLKASWTSNYLQSIGLDKKTSIWNCKIPRKTTSQRFIIPIEPSKIETSEVLQTSTCDLKTGMDKSKPYKIPKRSVENSNIMEDSNTKIKRIVKTTAQHVKDKSKNAKQSKHESTKCISGINSNDVKQNNKRKLLTNKNKSIRNDPNEIKRDNTKPNETHTPSTVIHSKKKGDIKTRRNQTKNDSAKPSTVRHSQKNDDIKTRRNRTKNDSAIPSTSYSSQNDNEKYKNSECSSKDVASIKNVEVTKNIDTSEINTLPGLKKAQHRAEPKTRVIDHKAEISDKTNTKENFTKNKSDLTLNKKIVRKFIKKNVPIAKNYRKIKLVINLICNNNPNSQENNDSSSNESNDESTTCAVPNVDLDFLNDFNIDEIIESLDTCEKNASQYIQSDRELNKHQSKENVDKQSVVSNVHTGENDTDAIDLLKTLKGEEDDDLMRISIENAEELLFSNDTEGFKNSHKSDDLSKSNKVSKDHPAVLLKVKEEKDLNILSEVKERVSCNAESYLKKANLIKNVGPIHIDKICTMNKDENTKEPQQTIFNRKIEESNHFAIVSIQSSSVCTTIESDQNKDKNNTKIKDEQNMTSFICDIDSLNTDSYNKLKLHTDITENKDQENCECTSIHNLTNIGNNMLDDQTVENLCKEDQNKNVSSLNDKSEKVPNIANAHKIVDKEKCYSTEILNTSEQSDNEINVINHERLFIGHQKAAEKQEESGKCINAIKDVNNSDNQKDIANSSLKQKNAENLTLINNNVKEKIAIPDVKEQNDKHEVDKGEINEDDLKNKEKDLSDKRKESLDVERELKDSDEITRGNIKSKSDQECILKLEDRLFSYSGSKYSIESIIHTGRFSKIFKCKHPNGKYYALKMQTTNIKNNFGKEKKLMLNSLVSGIPRNNLFIVYFANAFNVGENWCFLMEYYPKNLDQVLRETGKPFSIEHIQDYARQLVMAVMVLRNKDMVHLDINPRHILINSSNNMLKLCGFDSLCYFNQMKILPKIGTVNYRAPEVILGYESNFGIDVWSTGLVLYEMATNRKLFPGIFNNDILYKQICTLGCVPYDMIKKSLYNKLYFIGSQFIRRSGFKGQRINIIYKFNKNNILCDSIYDAYFENWRNHRSVSQQNSDIGKLSLFVKLLQKMLVMHPKSRLPIEFVYANPFIYDAYSYQEW